VGQELFALTTLTAGQLLCNGGHANNSQFLFVAIDVAAQSLNQSQRVGFVSLDAFVKFVPVLRPDHHM
jgi:hypothetical protein